MRHDLTSLQLFVTVAECRNLTRAAERAHLAVSAVSKRIAELEAQAGTPLLQRLPRGVVPTAAGQSLLRHARSVLQQLRALDAELQDFAGGLKGQVRLHAVATALTQFLPGEIESFLNRHPQVLLSIEEHTGAAVVRAVASGDADVGVVSALTPLRGLVGLPYHADRLMAGVPPGHPLARRRRLAFAELLDHPFVGPHADSSLAQLMVQAARAAGKPLRQRVQASSFDAMCRLVESRVGVTLLPDGVLRRAAAAGTLHAITLSDDWAQRQLLIVLRDEDTADPATRTLVDHLQAHAQRADPAGAGARTR
ncbi:LysR family transcriptional regulator [Pseudaquabacterium rugosum]|jgi:DNA-binding transcriptional LysR family regulator|uniref:LysR family transcriptional regulator n=1 Tax=Pseudaquabacterium rugosum TaxID=2984194 RepID=A0ABU9BF30_9BURK